MQKLLQTRRRHQLIHKKYFLPHSILINWLSNFNEKLLSTPIVVQYAMRKIAFLVISLGIFVSFLFTQVSNRAELATPTPTPESSVLSFPDPGIHVEGPFDGAQIKLINNLDKKLTAQEAKKEYKCEVLTNAAFYTKENKHVGLFVMEEDIVRSANKNALFDSFLTINSFFTPRITRTEPHDLVSGIQSGPLLIENGRTIKLSIIRDKEARRVVAAITGDNKLLFLVFFNSNSFFSGPLLAELPMEVKKYSDEHDLNIADAINLDGGSASAFLSNNIQLSELSPVGSFFCIS